MTGSGNKRFYEKKNLRPGKNWEKSLGKNLGENLVRKRNGRIQQKNATAQTQKKYGLTMQKGNFCF